MPEGEDSLTKGNWLLMGQTQLKPWLRIIDTTLGKIKPDSNKLKDSFPILLHSTNPNVILIGQSSTPL